MRHDLGASASAETGSREPGLASRPGPSGFDPARKGIIERMPTDFNLRWHGDHLSISGTCKTTHHLEAMAAALLVFRGCLPSTREAVAGDFGLERPERPFARQLAEFLGSSVAPQSVRMLPVMPSQRGGMARAAQRTAAGPQSEGAGA